MSMGWLCRRCNSENEFGETVCRACGTQAAAAYLLLERWRAGRERRAFAAKMAAGSKPVRPSVLERVKLKRLIGRINMAAASMLIVLLLAPVAADGTAEAFIASRLNSGYADMRQAQIQERLSGRLNQEAVMQAFAARAEELLNRSGMNAALLAERAGAALGRIREKAVTRGNSGAFSRLSEAMNRNMQAADMNVAEIEWRAAWFEPASWIQTAVEMLFE